MTSATLSISTAEVNIRKFIDDEVALRGLSASVHVLRTTSRTVTMQVEIFDKKMVEDQARLILAAEGLSPDLYGKYVTARGVRFKIVGFNPRAQKYPVIAERVPDGVSFKLSRSVLDRVEP